MSEPCFKKFQATSGNASQSDRFMFPNGVEMNVANVLFVIGKMVKLQRSVATKPNVPEQA
jgi:hypothetical protein